MNFILIILLLTIVFCAFFAGMESAFIATNKLRIELDRKQGVFGSEILKLFTNNPGQFIATMLIGRNLALVICGLLFAGLLGPELSKNIESDAIILIIITVVSVSVILIVAELLPRKMFAVSPNFFLNYLSIPALFFYSLFYPVTKLTLSASKLILRLFPGFKPIGEIREDLVFSKAGPEHFIIQDQGNSEESGSDDDNIKIFQNALDFSNVILRECMIPRTEIDAVDSTCSVAELKEKFIETGHSRILVYQNSIDNILGYFELKDIFTDPPDINSRIRNVAIVPETMAANKLLKLFVEEKKHVALVVDEFGGTSGMVTIEDVLEEIVGDIEDEHDFSELTEKKTGENEYIFSARHEVDYLNEEYNLSLPERDDYETLAGMILFYHGSMPAPNDIIRINNIIIKVLRVTVTRLELVSLKVT